MHRAPTAPETIAPGIADTALGGLRRRERGAYVKHNNNAGALDFDGVHRATPHVFSRFSFYASAGQLMIVDIQGVGNLWTDPQIHSLAGDDYGDGNLGVGGMALFFSTSRYGPVARSLGLPLFALSPAEQARIDAHQAQLAASNPTPNPCHVTLRLPLPLPLPLPLALPLTLTLTLPL